MSEANIIVEVLRDARHIVFITRNNYKYYGNISQAQIDCKMELRWNVGNRPYIAIFDDNDRVISKVNVNSESYKEQTKWFVDERFNV